MTQPKNAKDHSWNAPRWKGITRPYTHADVERLAGTVHIEHTLAHEGAEKFWKLLRSESYLPALGAMNGNQAVELAQAGLKAVYLGSSQLAGDRGLPATRSISAAVREVNHAMLRADRNSHIVGLPKFDWMLPIVADGESGFGGSLDAFESTKEMIEAGAAAVHFNDQLPFARTCGSVTGKVLIPTEDAIQKLVAARLAADTMGVATVIIARTDADSAGLLSSDHDTRDQRFLAGERTAEGFRVYRGGQQAAIARALAYAPYADLLWCESSELNLNAARKFAHAVHARFPGKMLAYHCSPSFHWRAKLNEEDIACFQRDLAAMGYRFQFLTLAGYHTANLSMHQFARDYVRSGMTAYSQIQQLELEMMEQLGHAKLERPGFAGAGFSKAVSAAITRGNKSGHAHYKPADAGPLEVDTEDYNDGEATERTPMPHLYLLLEPTLPGNAAND
jgi:isocitrate lyase